ncbi:hypothetical protein [Peribacillus deserti]|nr:hypothetical protein [Peribacillus deserti]
MIQMLFFSIFMTQKRMSRRQNVHQEKIQQWHEQKLYKWAEMNNVM